MLCNGPGVTSVLSIPEHGLSAHRRGRPTQELLLRNEYVAMENEISRAQIRGRVLLSEAGKKTLADIATARNRNHHRCNEVSPPTLRARSGFSAELGRNGTGVEGPPYLI